MADRDNNGMTAADWKSADVSVIESRTLRDHKDNVELFNQIKGIVSDAVNIIRGDAKSDDKYRNIVDLIMMRVRAALSERMSDVSFSVDTEKLSNDLFQDLDKKLKQSAEKNESTSSSFNEKEFLDVITSSIEKAICNDGQESGQQNGEQTDQQQEQVDTKSLFQQQQANYDQIINNIQQQFQKLEDTITGGMTSLAEKISSIKVSGPDMSFYDTYTTACIDVIHEEFQKLDDLITYGISTLESQAISGQKPVDYDFYEQYICDCIEKIEKITSSMGSSQPKSGKEVQKQIQVVKNYINDNFSVIKSKLDNNLLVLKDHIDRQNKMLTDIIDRQKKSSLSFTTILLLIGIIGGVLVAAFWPQIKGFLDKIDFEKYFKKLYDAVGQLWNKIYPFIKPALEAIGETIKESFMSLIHSPVDYVVNKFKRLYDAFTEFKDDIWGWVTGKTKETAQAKDEQEKKAEAKVAAQLQSNITSADKMLNASNKNIDSQLAKNEQVLNNTVKTTESAVAAQTDKLDKNVEGSVQTIQQQTSNTVQNVNQNVTQMAADAQASTDNITNTVLPNTTQQLEQQTDSNVKSLDGRLNSQIEKAEASANDQIAKAEEKAKVEGNPTEITTDSLNKLDSAANGSDLSGGIDKKPQTPSDVEQLTITEQNKTKTLYSNKDDAAALKQNNQQITEAEAAAQNGQGQPGAVQPSQVSSKLIVNADSPDFKQGKPEDFRDIVQHAESIESVYKAGNKMLETVIGNVQHYFSDLNSCIDRLSKNQKQNGSSNTVIVAPQQKGGSLIAADNK